MSEFRVDQIKNQAGTRGPDIAGITTFSGTSGIVMPSGNTIKRNINEDIVQDGLVLYLDAANKISYPGSGTFWRDLSSNNTNNGTLTSGPTFDSDDGGSISFGGTNEHVKVGSNNDSLNLTTGFTVSFWMKNSNISTNQYFVNRWNYNGVNNRQWSIDAGGSSDNNNWNLRFRISTDGTDSGVVKFCKVSRFYRWETNNTPDDRSLPRYVNPDIADGNWHNICGTWNGAVQSLYIDGILMVSVPKTSMVSTSGDPTLIGGGNDGTALNMTGNISQVSMYNRALDLTEVIKNYNAIKGRYGG